MILPNNDNANERTDVSIMVLVAAISFIEQTLHETLVLLI